MDKIEMTTKGFKWLRETLYLYGRAKMQGDDKLCEHIENEINLIETIVKNTLKDGN